MIRKKITYDNNKGLKLIEKGASKHMLANALKYNGLCVEWIIGSRCYRVGVWIKMDCSGFSGLVLANSYFKKQ